MLPALVPPHLYIQVERLCFHFPRISLAYLSEIVGSEVSTVNYIQYIKTVKNLSIKRELIKACQDALNMVYGENIDIRDVIATLETKMFSASDMYEEKTVNLEELMTQSIDLIDNGYKNGGQLLGTTTGYKPLDNAINGFVK